MTALRAGAKKTRDKMQQATDLIGGLAGERKRWTEDSAKFDATKTALVGDVAVGAISASRRVEAPSLHSNDSCPSHFHESGFFVEFERVPGGVIDTYHTQVYRQHE